MTNWNLDELLRNEEGRRREFPVCEKKIFLSHAAVSPLPRRVGEAMQRYLDAAMRDDQEGIGYEGILRETRKLAARLIGAGPDEIAFVNSTSMGLSLVAAGLPWQAGDNVVCYRDDYPANVYPWMNLRQRGVDVRFVEPSRYGNVTVADLERVLDGRTRLVSLASAHFVSGWRLDVEAIGRFLRGRGVLFCLDGIQTFGAMNTPVEWVDFASADAHKWMLGPLGAAILYVRRPHWDALRPVLLGAHNVLCPDYITQDRIVLRSGAMRYEPGSFNLVGIVGMREALKMILGTGLAMVEQRVLELSARIRAGGVAKGYEPVGPGRDDNMRTGIISFRQTGDGLKETWERLTGKGVVCSLRRSREGGRALRFSPHFYNTEAEIDQLIERL
jgi:selenocysteine lyase/cysteine desulfurase